MSQAGIINTSSGPVPPTVPISFVTDSGTATAALNILNVVTPGSGTQGVKTTAPGSSNTILITVQPADVTGSVQTVGLQTKAVITFALGGTSGTYTFDSSVAGFAIAGAGLPLGCGFTIVGAVRTDGITATLLPNQAVDHFEDALLVGVTAVLSVSGNNALINVTGIAAYTIDWTAFLNYTLAT